MTAWIRILGAGPQVDFLGVVGSRNRANTSSDDVH